MYSKMRRLSLFDSRACIRLDDVVRSAGGKWESSNRRSVSEVFRVLEVGVSVYQTRERGRRPSCQQSGGKLKREHGHLAVPTPGYKTETKPASVDGEIFFFWG